MESFYRRFVDTASRYPDHIAVELQATQSSSAAGERYSYAELRRIAEHLGGWLQQSGIAAGSRCAILANNSPRWVAAYLGIMAAGGVAVPLDTAFKPEQVAKLLKDSGASLLFVDASHLETAKSAWSDIDVEPAALGRVFVIDSQPSAAQNLDAVLAKPVQPLAPLNAAPDDLAVLLYTSGTTSDPKGVMLTHGNLNAEADAVFRSLQLGPDDAILGVLPLFHALAQMANLLLPLSVGMRVVYLETLNTTELLRALRERKITAFAVVPQFFYLIHERISKEVAERGNFAKRGLRLLMGLNRLLRKFGGNAGPLFFGRIHETFGREMRYLVTGGSRFDPKIARDFHALGIDILQAYGLTETTGGAFVNRPSDIVIGSVGQPLPGVEAKIIEAKNDSSNRVDSKVHE